MDLMNDPVHQMQVRRRTFEVIIIVSPHANMGKNDETDMKLPDV